MSTQDSMIPMSLALLASIPEGDAAALLERLAPSQLAVFAAHVQQWVELDGSLPHRIEQELGSNHAPGKQTGPCSRFMPLNQACFDSTEEIAKADPIALAKILRSELPQTVAAILRLLSPDSAAHTLSHLSTVMQLAVTQRIAQSHRANASILSEICIAVACTTRQTGAIPLSPSSGVVAVARILDHLSSATELALVENLQQEDPLLLQRIQNLRDVLQARRHAHFVACNGSARAA